MIFKDIDLSTLDAILINAGERHSPERVYNEYGTLPGSSTPLYEDTGTFLPYERTVEILFKDRTEEGYVNQWLTGSGILIMDDDGYYKARVKKVDTVTKPYKIEWLTKIITFEIQPFLFRFAGDAETTLTSGQTIYNPGMESDPYIKITGSGSVTLTINAVAYDINPIDQYVEIEFPFAWKGTTPKGRTLLDGFPKLAPGNNVISWSGTVTEVKIKGRWRTL